MVELQLQYDIRFYVATFVVAALAGIVSTFNGDNRIGYWNILASGCLGGFVAVASVGVLVGSLGGTVGSEPRYIGLAILIGVTGQKSLKIAYYTLDVISQKIGMTNGPEDDPGD